MSYQEHIDSDLLALVLEVVDVGSRHAFSRVRQDT